ncbi:LPXTG cell wall anchor domain-containing protein [Streptomyces sp. NPDC051322]|uniref:LPXTG cell wall anchor domain-containing protein n=1 Tax=Streptomyces sp. NPDC051322 TaxID=3154645 RepID=UPI00344FA24F
MSHLIQQHGRLWARAGVALACAGVLTLTGLPSLQGTAYAAKGKRCDETYGLSGNSAGSMPWDRGVGVRNQADWDSYNYDAPRQALDGLTLPADPAERDKILDKLTKPYDQYPKGSPDRVYATYRDFLQRDPSNARYGTFEKWLNDAYILPNNNNRRGAFFEKKVVKDLGLLGPDWLCQEEIAIRDKDGNPVKDPKTGKPLVRKFDAVNYKTNEYLEFKAGGGRDTKQDLSNQKFLEDPQRRNARIGYVNGEEKQPATRNYLNRLGEQAGRDAQGRPRVVSYEHRSTSVPEYQRGTYSKPDPYMNTGGRTPSGGAARAVEGSAPTPKDMAERMARIRANDPQGLRVRGPGGVDFSTLELSYVGKPVKNQGLNYSFAAKKADEDANLGWGGKEKAQLISDSFFTWLALTPDKFWVNLNPDQPDKIMDKTFGKTDAGRVLLQADLAMKHDYAKDMDPRKELGKRYWQAMRAAGLDCGTVVRNWIVPRPAKVRADENGIYILDAPLKVNSVASDVKTPSPNGKCDLTDAQRKTSQRLVNEIIIPDVEHQVNTAPQYADLRRVYSARVAAEYVRQQDQQHATDYRTVINSNDVAKWPVRGKNKSWTPRQTWEEYVKSFTQGDYSYPCEFAGQQKTCVMGGVDFSKSPKRNVSRVEFTVQHKNLPRSTKTSVQAMTDDADNGQQLLLGGGGSQSGGGGQSPTPTPSHSGTPTGRPSAPATHTPTPGHSTPAPGPSTPPDRNGGGGGGLADTGTQVLTLAGIAAALLAAGAGLVWWRRRNTGTGS